MKTNKELSKEVLKIIKTIDKNVVGSLYVKEDKNTIYISGQIHTAKKALEFEKAIRSAFSEQTVILSNIFNNGLTVVSEDSFTTTKDPTGELDEVEITYFGLLEADKIVSTQSYKRINSETLIKVKRAIEIAGFIAPIVLDSDNNVIDGNLRLDAIRKLYGNKTGKKVPVVIINDNGVKADFLRLVLNRSSEFQKWIYSDVDTYVDEHPQLQPVLEPLGFFSNKVLPQSFFGKTIVNYEIDEYNSQQKMYSQDIGLAGWAEHRKKAIKAKEAERLKELNRKKSDTQGKVSLFDLVPEEKDLLPTYDISEELEAHTLEQREVAGVITENFDEIRKEAKELAGHEWQTTRRESKEKAADKKAEALAKAKEEKKKKKD